MAFKGHAAYSIRMRHAINNWRARGILTEDNRLVEKPLELHPPIKSTPMGPQMQSIFLNQIQTLLKVNPQQLLPPPRQLAIEQAESVSETGDTPQRIDSPPRQTATELTGDTDEMDVDCAPEGSVQHCAESPLPSSIASSSRLTITVPPATSCVAVGSLTRTRTRNGVTFADFMAKNAGKEGHDALSLFETWHASSPFSVAARGQKPTAGGSSLSIKPPTPLLGDGRRMESTARAERTPRPTPEIDRKCIPTFELRTTSDHAFRHLMK